MVWNQILKISIKVFFTELFLNQIQVFCLTTSNALCFLKITKVSLILHDIYWGRSALNWYCQEKKSRLSTFTCWDTPHERKDTLPEVEATRWLWGSPARTYSTAGPVLLGSIPPQREQGSEDPPVLGIPNAGLGAGPSPALAQSHLSVSAPRTSQNNRAGRSLHTACSRSSSRDAPQLCGPKCSKPPVFKMFLQG